MKKKAIAYQEYNEAAMVDMLMGSLPLVLLQQVQVHLTSFVTLVLLRLTHQVAAEIAEPIAKTRKITMVSSNGDMGAAKLTGEVLSIMTQMPEMIKSLSGIDISKVQHP